jgi:hypothetical protein
MPSLPDNTAAIHPLAQGVLGSAAVAHALALPDGRWCRDWLEADFDPALTRASPVSVYVYCAGGVGCIWTAGVQGERLSSMSVSVVLLPYRSCVLTARQLGGAWCLSLASLSV